MIDLVTDERWSEKRLTLATPERVPQLTNVREGDDFLLADLRDGHLKRRSLVRDAR